MKGERIAQLELLLRSHPEGLRCSEIARRLGVHRSTISRYMSELEEQDVDIYKDNNLIKIRESSEDDNLPLSIYESIAFNISAEILASNSEIQNPHLASGLRKMAMNMRSYAPKISDNLLEVAEKIDQEVQKNKDRNGNYNAILEGLIDAWVSGRIVRIETEGDEIEMAPYFIGFREEGQNRHPITVTGRLRHTKEIVTLDISSIKNVTLLDETYTIPDNLKPFKQSEEEKTYDAIDMIPLVLSMTEKSAANAFHGINHGEFKFEKSEDGLIKCSFLAENSIELMLKIFQCGRSVKILAPESYKKRYVSYLKEITDLYGNN